MTVSEFINKIGFKVKQDDVKKVNDTIAGIKSTAAKLLGAIGIGFSLTNLNAIAEEFNGINDKINFAVKGLADQKEAQEAILKAANETKSTYAAMAGTVTNLVKAGSDLFSVDEAVQFSSAVSKLWGAYGVTVTNAIANAVSGIVGKLNTFSEWLVEHKDAVIKFGGVIAGIVPPLMAVRKAATVISSLKIAEKVIPIFNVLKGVIGKLGSAFSFLASPVGIAVAVIAAVLAIAYDFFNFMKGKDSVIGKIFEKMGVDCDAVRQKVTEIWNKVKEHLLSVWNAIKSVAEDVWGGLKAFWSKHGEQIKRSFENIWTGIKKTVIAVWDVIKAALVIVWNVIKTVAVTVFNKLKAFWDTWGQTIIAAFKGIWEIIKSMFGAVFDVLADIFAIFSDIFAGDWSQLWEDVKQYFSDVWNGVVNILSSVFDTLAAILAEIFMAIGNVLSNIWTKITEVVGNIKDAVVEGFTAAIDWIKGLPSQALQWGKDIIMGIVDGIKGAAEAVGDAVKGVADKIKSFLGFSEPEDGPLSDFHTYMPDMIDLMAKGISAGKSKIKEAVSALTGDMSVGIKAKADDISLLAGSGEVSGLTLSAASGQNNVSKSIVQNIEINNEFNGDRTGQRESSNAMDKASTDCTSELARAMAYAR
ncbi:MAG: hypothetical protein NC452_02200 [Eubacterium sp.]|nr:hypothetical protein [Eubacterium sp.]